jgi:hypothetical protein
LLTVRLSDDAIAVLAQEADAREMSVSACVRALLCAGASTIGADSLAVMFTKDDFVSKGKWKSRRARVGLNICEGKEFTNGKP